MGFRAVLILVWCCSALAGCRKTDPSGTLGAPLATPASPALSAPASGVPSALPGPPLVAPGASADVANALVPPAPSGAPVGTIPTKPTSYLWKLASPVATLHLLGSVHVATKDTYPLAPVIETAFANASTLVVEVDLSGNAKASAAQTMLARAVYGPGDTIAKHISHDVYGQLRLHLLTSGQPSTSMDQLKPWFVGITVTLLELQRGGFSPNLGIDEHFLSRAEGQKRIVALETIEQQVDTLSKLDDVAQGELLAQALADIPTLPTTMTQALSLWQAGDAAGVDALLVAPTREKFPRVYERLIAERNRRMAAKIEELLRQEGHYFVVVGAAHLCGKDGIPSLLERKGRTSTQL